MKHLPPLLILAVAAAGSPAEPVATKTNPLDPVEIVRRSDELLRGEKSYAEITMAIERPEWKRALTMQAWSQGTDKSLIRIQSPRKDQGVAFLKDKRQGWQYVPAIDRTIKIPPSMMLQSWMGSDFTNDDVVRADSIVVDYTHRVTGETEAHWDIEAVPKPDAPVVWGKVALRIRKDGFVLLQADYFDEDGEKMKSMTTSNFTEIEGRKLATSLTMRDLTRPGYATHIDYRKLTFKPDLQKDTFSLRNLRR